MEIRRRDISRRAYSLPLIGSIKSTNKARSIIFYKGVKYDVNTIAERNLIKPFVHEGRH